MFRRLSCYLCVLLAMSLATVAVVPRESALYRRWSMPIDSRNTSDWLSVRAGVVYTVRNAHVVAIELTNGRVRWTSAATVDSRPAIGGRTIFAPVIKGVVALDTLTGKELGRRPLEATPELVTTDSVAVSIVNTGRTSRLTGFPRFANAALAARTGRRLGPS